MTLPGKLHRYLNRYLKPAFAIFGSIIFVFAGIVLWEEFSYTKPEQSPEQSGGTKVALVYSPRYNITAFGMERLHPFDGSKYRKIKEAIVHNVLRKPDEFLCPEEMPPSTLKLVHSQKYLGSLNDSRTVAEILEIPVASVIPSQILDWRILRGMRYGAGGTLLAGRAALQSGLAINIGGGYHHADHDCGGGFCVYCDVPASIATLRNEGLIRKALIVDTDAHQGNGFANVSAGQPDTFMIDFFDDSIYPYPKVTEDFSVPFEKGVPGSYYLKVLQEKLPPVIEEVKPDIIFYNAGADVLESDPLSNMRVSPEQLVERDLFVVSTARKYDIPIAMVLAGGYSKDSASAQADSICAILRKFDKENIRVDER
ncbi:MAG TPA: histone deacetylase [Candidatus Melainabacteria bacterium]|nr:histone deacetylase [Candidatus Melainabacteria bacterium]